MPTTHSHRCFFPAWSLFPMLPCAFPAGKCFPACSCFPIALRIGTSAGSCFPMLPQRLPLEASVCQIADAQTDANLSAHLHRLLTPPPYLRQMRLSPGRGRRCCLQDEAAAWPGGRCCVQDEAVARPGAAFLQITARTNPCSRHLWGTLARAVASICAHRASC